MEVKTFDVGDEFIVINAAPIFLGKHGVIKSKKDSEKYWVEVFLENEKSWTGYAVDHNLRKLTKLEKVLK